MRRLRLALLSLIVAGLAHTAFAQSAPPKWEVGAQVPSARSSQFDTVDTGIGGRVSWYPLRAVGVEAEINVYPREFPKEQPVFSRSRIEGLFGATAGVSSGRLRLFATLRPGFLQLRPAPRAFACIAIFPPPLACELASGGTLLAIDAGGGVSVGITPGTFVRVDAGDRLVRYPGPVFDTDRQIHQEPFFAHEFRVAFGAGLRF